MPRTTNTAFRRFECIDPERNPNKFHELSVEMLLFGPTVIRRWGRIGSRRPSSLSKGYEIRRSIAASALNRISEI